MRVLLQRVRRARVSVDEELVAGIGHGLLLFVGVGEGDTKVQAEWLANKCAGLRVFDDDDGKSNYSVLNVDGSALVVPQFTLYADTSKGRRPSFV
ncbi:MAG: D-aminoacyl-tRNA deacylase, partial [Anaerolineales bacterium]|nr:D-aminoacyl-tRNA deacylase [Anaerolineales bacterium]